MQILETITSTFRGRSVTFAQSQVTSSKNVEGKAVNRWLIYKQLCIAKSIFGISDRSLAVLSALLSFLPENDISTKNGLVVFPSNRQLSLRAHGMPESTLRRHLASLIEAGLIARRDSPNGKRYAYKDRAGEVEEAFGFTFAPLLERADEIGKAAEKVQADALLLKRTREQITLQRRDLAQMIDVALSDTPTDHWMATNTRFRAIVDAIPRRASLNELELILNELATLRTELDNYLNLRQNVEEMSGNHAQNERHYIESQPESLFESKNVKKNDLKSAYSIAPGITKTESSASSPRGISLDLVLRTCPDIRDYSSNDINSWRDLVDASQIVSRFLGISQSAYWEATQLMGQEAASTVIAWILQRMDTIQSAGGYLRSLTQKAKMGEFSISNMLSAAPKIRRVCGDSAKAPIDLVMRRQKPLCLS